MVQFDRKHFAREVDYNANTPATIGAIPHVSANIVHFGGQHYAKTFGIEFDTATVPPPEYSEIPLLELLK